MAREPAARQQIRDMLGGPTIYDVVHDVVHDVVPEGGLAMAKTGSEINAPGRPPAIAAAGPLGYALVQAAKAHKALAAVLLREIGLYPGQELLLMHLWDEDERSQAELVRAMSLDASTVARMVARLEEQGIVRRRASSVDGRAVIVSLTPRGTTLCGEVGRVWGELEVATTRGLTERQRADVLRGLRRVASMLAAPG